MPMRCLRLSVLNASIQKDPNPSRTIQRQICRTSIVYETRYLPYYIRIDRWPDQSIHRFTLCSHRFRRKNSLHISITHHTHDTSRAGEGRWPTPASEHRKGTDSWTARTILNIFPFPFWLSPSWIRTRAHGGCYHLLCPSQIRSMYIEQS